MQGIIMNLVRGYEADRHIRGISLPCACRRYRYVDGSSSRCVGSYGVIRSLSSVRDAGEPTHVGAGSRSLGLRQFRSAHFFCICDLGSESATRYEDGDTPSLGCTVDK